MNGDGLLRLEEKDEGTALHYEIEAQVGGRIASVGQRLLDSSAKVITRQGLEGLARQVEPQETSDSGPAAAAGDPAGDVPPPAPPSQARFAGSFLAGLIGELVPKERRPLVIVAAVLITLTLIAVFLRTCGG